MLAPAQLHCCGHEPKAAAPSARKSMPISSKRYATTTESTNGTINLIADFKPENTRKTSTSTAFNVRIMPPQRVPPARLPVDPRSLPVSGSD
jgi:hypothetical protein